MPYDKELSITFAVASVLIGINGLVILFGPEWFFMNLLGYPPVEKLGMLRWPAGALLGIALGLWLARSELRSARPMLALAVSGSSIYVLTILYSLVVGEGGAPGAMWFYIVLYTAFALQFLRLYTRARNVDSAAGSLATTASR